MISTISSVEQLHRRFDVRSQAEAVAERYRVVSERFRAQTNLLQQSTEFRTQCEHQYYSKGYPDWVILSAAYNRLFNIRSPMSPTTPPASIMSAFRTFDATPANPVEFGPDDMKLALFTFFISSMKVMGFEVRRRGHFNFDYGLDEIESFLRKRMLYFEFDIPHPPLFGQPLGRWPERLEIGAVQFPAIDSGEGVSAAIEKELSDRAKRTKRNRQRQ